MAIAPNTTFVSGAVLTAAQQNAFPFGVVSFTKNTTLNPAITTDATQITGTAFTAIANRNYRVTYYEPNLQGTLKTGYVPLIKNGATTLNSGSAYGETLGYSTGSSCVYVGTFTAGSVTLTASLSATAGSATANRSATAFAFLLVEDIGPA